MGWGLLWLFHTAPAVACVEWQQQQQRLDYCCSADADDGAIKTGNDLLEGLENIGLWEF